MDEILYLEPDEEITSVIDKLKKSSGASVGLVIPRNSGLIHSIVNLKLLKKQAEAQMKEIALVTSDKIGKNIASQVGIQVFEDVHAKRPVSTVGMPELPKGDEVIEVDMTSSANEPIANAGSAPKVKHYGGGEAAPKLAKKPVEDDTVGPDYPEEAAGAATVAADYQSTNDHAAHVAHPIKERSEPAYMPIARKEKKGNKGSIIFITIFTIIVLATLLLLPQTAVDVIVAAEPFEKAIPLTIDKSVQTLNNDDHVAPGKLIEVTNDDAHRVVATGKKDVGGKSKGTVSMANSYDANSLKFPAGTKLTIGDKVFLLDNDTIVPGATAAIKEGQLVTNPGTVNAAVSAIDPGDSYNVKAGSFTIAGLTDKQQGKITATSSKDFVGGFTKTVTIMTQADIDTAKDALAQDLNTAGIELIKKEARTLKVINEAIVNDVVTAETNPAKADTETDYFDIKVKVKHRAMVFDEKQVQSIVDKAIKQEVPKDKELLLGEGDEFVVDVQGKDYDNGKLELESKIKTKVGNHVDIQQVKSGINGKNEAAIRSQLASSIPGVKQINFYKFPRWWWQDTSFASWNTHIKVIYE